MNKPTDRTIFQNAWVVDDLEQACMKWVNELGVGPFFVTDYSVNSFSDVTYRGDESELAMRVAISQAGPVQIELIEPLNEPNTYRDVYPKGKTGFHHMCVWTHDFDADQHYFDQLGYAAVTIGRTGSARFGYFDTRPLLGCMLEIVTYKDAIAARFDKIREVAENWDGQDPIR